MIAYELHRARHAELQRRADDWRLAREARCARAAERRGRARRTQDRTAARHDAEGSASPRSRAAGPFARLDLALRRRRAA